MKEIHFILIFLFLHCIQQTVSVKRAVTSHPLYTSDYVNNLFPFSSYLINPVMKLLNGQSNEYPFPTWTNYIELNNTNGQKLYGFIAFEYQKYEPNIHEPDYADACRMHHYEESNEAQLQDIYSGKSVLHFEDFDFGQTEEWQALKIESRQKINETGVWLNIVHLCIEKDGHYHQIELSRQQSAINPFGYLGGDYLITMPCLVVLSAIYIILSMLWLYWTLKYCGNLLSVHWLIYVGINLSLFATLIHLLRYKSYNISGEVSMKFVIGDVASSLILSLYVRIAMVVISSGAGIVFPHLKRRTVCLAMIYSLFYVGVAGVVKWYEMNLQMHKLSAMSYQGWIISLALLDAIINWYCMENLQNIFVSLRSEKQNIKLSLYRKLVAVLFIAMLISIIGMLAHIYFINHQMYTMPKYWSLFWLLRDGMWRLLFLMIGIAVICIWKPHQHSLKYAYSMEVALTKHDAEMNDDDIEVTIVSNGGGAAKTKEKEMKQEEEEDEEIVFDFHGI